MHKMGWKWMTFVFFRFELALLRWICWLDWLSGSEEHQKILWGCMHAAGVGGKTLHLGLLNYLRLGAWICKTYMAFGISPGMDTKLWYGPFSRASWGQLLLSSWSWLFRRSWTGYTASRLIMKTLSPSLSPSSPITWTWTCDLSRVSHVSRKFGDLWQRYSILRLYFSISSASPSSENAFVKSSWTVSLKEDGFHWSTQISGAD